MVKKIMDTVKKTLERKGNTSKNKRSITLQYAMIVLLAGVVFMLGDNFFSSTSTQQSIPNDTPVAKMDRNEENTAVFGQKEDSLPSTMVDYERRYENQLKETLEAIVGVKDVTVMVNLDATESKVLEKNLSSQSQLTDETDREGGKRKVEDKSRDEQIVIVRNGDKEQPVIIKTQKPKVRGVLVVADGADNLQVKKWIIEAVTRVLDVPNHRVAVMPKKTKGE